MTDEDDVPSWKATAWMDGALVWVLGLLGFETLTGLSVWLLPFTVANQIAVLLHTAVGLAFLIPFGWFQATHWWHNREAPLSCVSLTGYFSLAATLAALVSGAMLTVQAVFSRSIGEWWVFAHQASTLAVVGSVVAHLVVDLWRHGVRLDRRITSARKRLRAAAAGSLLRATGLAAGLIAIGLLLAGAYRSATPSPSPDPDRSAVATAGHPAQGKNPAFEPSLARTASGRTVAPELLGGSAGCGASGCHRQIYREWQPSAHRYSALDTAFQAVQRLMSEQVGRKATRYCAGCHDPVSLFAGSKRAGGSRLTHPIGRDEGVSCLVCHAVDSVDVRGNADYAVDVPERYIFWRAGNPLARELNHFLIRSYPEYHRRSLQPKLLRTPEFCAGCHKQFVPARLTGSGWVGLQNQYDNWRKSRWNHPGEPGEAIQCRECHMPLVESNDPAAGDRLDYNRATRDGKHRSHRFLGGNQFIPVFQDLKGGRRHARLTERWLKGEIEIPEIDDKWTDGPAVPIELDAPSRVESTDSVRLRVRVVNNKPGHNFPTGPLDLLEAWVQVVVTDRAGDTIYHAGLAHDAGPVDRNDFVFRAQPVDSEGRSIVHHELWELVGVRWARAVYPGFSDRQTFSFPAPAGQSLLRVEAELRYRKFNPTFLEFLDGTGPPIDVPVTTVSRSVARVRVAPGADQGGGDEPSAPARRTPRPEGRP